jgi:glycosyltransferase involved in cell wall biosynthesis
MRILHTINSVDAREGGPIEGIRQLAGVMAEWGHRVEVASLDAPGAPYLKTFPATVHALGPGSLMYGYAPRFVPWLRQHAQEYDAVIVNGIWQYQCLGTWRALHKSGTPYVVFTHGMLDPWFKRTYPLKHAKKWLYWPWGCYPALRDAHGVLFTCEEERLLARQSFWLYKVREVVTNYGTGDAEGDTDAQKAAIFERFPELRDKRLVLYMGRLHPRKGCELAVQAYAKVLGDDPNWRLVMAGPDPVAWQGELEAMAGQLGAADKITWTGMLHGDLKWGALRASEILLLPSHGENFGIVVAEALACGVPVLISDKVNIWREVGEDRAGLVATDDLPDTCRALAQWAGMPDNERAILAANARPCFLRRFEIHAAAESLLRTLTIAIDGRLVSQAL